MPDHEEELVVQASLNQLHLTTENEFVEEEEDFFEWSENTTLKELFGQFPDFKKGKKALKIDGDELILV
jgi:hypothetical protein